MSKRTKTIIAVIMFLFMVNVLLAVDMYSKTYIYGHRDGEWLIPGVISFYSTENPGIAFGFLTGGGIWLAVIACILTVVAAIAWWFTARKSVFGSVAFAFFIAGAIGNLYDRFVYGHVRDFMQFDFLPAFAVFNFADVFINIGTAFLIVYYVVTNFPRRTKNAAS